MTQHSTKLAMMLCLASTSLHQPQDRMRAPGSAAAFRNNTRPQKIAVLTLESVTVDGQSPRGRGRSWGAETSDFQQCACSGAWCRPALSKCNEAPCRASLPVTLPYCICHLSGGHCDRYLTSRSLAAQQCTVTCCGL